MKNSRSIVNNRREKILEEVKRNGDVNVADLAERYEVSLLTIRRDLQYLEEHSMLERYYGGARISLNPKKRNHIEQINLRKEKIAKYAASLVEDGDSIFINTSSTALATLKYITKKNVTIVTNNGNIIAEPNPSDATIILLGGELRYKKGTMVGDFTMNNLRNITVRKSFMGCGGICPDIGMTTELSNEVNINQTMFERTNFDSYILADSSKFGEKKSFVSCPVEKIENIITDKNVDKRILEKFERKGIGIYLVD